jgi:mono/diheme cytochrome c family protein
MLTRFSLVAALLLAGPSFARGGQEPPKPHPIVPAFERFGASDGAEAGRLLLGELNCVTCHKPDPAAAEHFSVKKAPLLADVGSRLKAEWVRDFIADPQKLKPGATMPQPALAPAELDALTHFLMSLKRAKPIEAGGGGPAVKAKDLFNRVGCAACHSPLDGPPLPGSVPIPDLKAKFATPAALAAFLADPLTVRPSGRMPKLNLTQGEAMALAAHFVGLPPRESDRPEDTLPGMTYEVFDGTFSKMPDFDGLKPIASGVADRFDARVAKKEENFAIRFRGYLEAPQDGLYSFSVHSDDGSVLRIGSTTVVNNDGVHGGTEVTGSIALRAGKHAFSLGFFQGGGGAELRVQVEGPKSKRDVPAAALSRPRTGTPVVRESPAAGGAAFTPDPAMVEKGRELFTMKRCATCHEGVPGAKPLEFKPLARIPSAGGCLSGTPAHL